MQVGGVRGIELSPDICQSYARLVAGIRARVENVGIVSPAETTDETRCMTKLRYRTPLVGFTQ